MTLRWTIARLGDVCQTGAGGTPLSTRKEYYEGGKIPWLVSGEVAQGEITSSSNFITDLGLNNSSARVFPEDTVLVAMYGATAGQVGILRFPAATNQAVCGILPNDKFIPKFMYYLFLSKKQELISQAAGNAQPNISQLKIKNTRVPVPPLPEQQRIVTILDNAFAGLATASANAEENLTNARELFDNYVDSVFVAGGAGWIRRQIGELATTQYGLSGTLNGEGIGHKVFRMGEVQDGVLVDTGQMKFIDIDDAEFKQYRLNRGDVLFNRTNSSELVGKTGLFDIDGDYCFARISSECTLIPRRWILGLHRT